MSQNIVCIQPRAVIFDLDGTLLNTAPDIVGACNATLSHFGFQPISEALAMTRVTAGMREMLKLGVPQEQWGSADIEGSMRSWFAQYYIDHINDRTRPFEGMIELLCDLEQAGIKVAVVTNKYENMAQKLLQQYSFYDQLALVLGCDSIEHAKPHPEPVLMTLEHLKVQPFEAVYAGDHLNDIIAANLAKTISAAALWGYGGKECGTPDTWHAHFLLPAVSDLRRLCLP